MSYHFLHFSSRICILIGLQLLKQASTPLYVKVERECTGWELESRLILSGKFLGCARGMNTMGPKMNLKEFEIQNRILMTTLFMSKMYAICITI